MLFPTSFVPLNLAFKAVVSFHKENYFNAFIFIIFTGPISPLGIGFHEV